MVYGRLRIVGQGVPDWMATGMNGDAPNPNDDDAAGTIYLPNGNIIVVAKDSMELRRGLPFWADGSGCNYAMGAMQMGATAEQAVAAAMAWDRYTGGRIVTVSRCR